MDIQQLRELIRECQDEKCLDALWELYDKKVTEPKLTLVPKDGNTFFKSIPLNDVPTPNTVDAYWKYEPKETTYDTTRTY